MPPSIRKRIEQSLKVNLQSVRVHTDAHANEVAGSLSARAVTYGNHIFLGRGERATDLGLITHEVAHVVQQQRAPKLQPSASGQNNAYETEAQHASAAVIRHEPFTVSERTSGPRVQRLGISDALDYFADKANNIPGFRMFTIVLGVNPINMRSVARTAANVMRAVVEFIPGGGLITQALDNYGIFDKVGNWVDQQIRSLGMIGSAFKQAVTEFLDSLGWSDIFDLGDVWSRAKRIFTDPIDQIINFVKGFAADIIKFIKDAILRPLAKLAEGTRGYDLLKAVMGQDPITGDPVPQTADTLIGGFMKLIGQEEVWNNLKKANAVARAWSWFQSALSELMGFVREIPSLFVKALESLVLEDIILLPQAFAKVGRVFADFVGRFISWAIEKVMKLLEIIFEVLAPAAVPYIKKAAGAFKKIIENPIGFIGNLVRAGIQGFNQFASNFLKHLKKSLIDWITGTLSGASIYIPQSLDLREIIKFVLSVLGLTWENIRQKLVKAIGETAVKAMEAGFDIVVTLVTQGPAAAWEKIKEGVSNLQQMVMDEIMSFVKRRVVEAAIKKLVTSLNPAGAFIQAVIAIYNTIMFFIERLKQIKQVAMSFIDSISAIANGVIGAAANRVETTMAGLLTLVISFLARFAGLGKVSDAVINIVNKVRTPIDKALDRVIEWIMTMAKRLLSAGKNLAGKVAGWLGLRKTFKTIGGKSHTMFFKKQGTGGQLSIRSAEMSLEIFLADLATKYAGDKDKLPKVKAAQGLVGEIKTLTAVPPTGGGVAAPTATEKASADAAVQEKVNQLGVILQEVGDGVSLKGAGAAYRGMHFWVDPAKTPVEADEDYQKRLNKEVLGIRIISDAVKALLAATLPAGREATPADIDDAVSIVREKLKSLEGSGPYEAEGKVYVDRFHFLLGRYVMNLTAFKKQLREAGEPTKLDEGIKKYKQDEKDMGSLSKDAKRKLDEMIERRNRQPKSPYRQVQPEVQASPFIATSLSPKQVARYSLGLKGKPSDTFQTRTVGTVGRIIILVAGAEELFKDGTYNIEELRGAGKIRISEDMKEDEITFTDVPGKYVRGQLNVGAGHSQDAIASSAQGRAAAEAARFGGLK